MSNAFTRMTRLALTAALLLSPATLVCAGEPSTAARPRTTQTSAPETYSAEVFDALERVEDSKLDDRRAGHRHHHEHHGHGGLSGGEVVLCVFLMIIFLPLGILVLVILLVD